MIEITHNNIPEALTILLYKIDRLEKQATKPEQDNSKLYTITEACQFLSICKPTLYALTSKGGIDFLKPAKRVYFTKQHLLDYLAKK